MTRGGVRVMGSTKWQAGKEKAIGIMGKPMGFQGIWAVANLWHSSYLKIYKPRKIDTFGIK